MRVSLGVSPPPLEGAAGKKGVEGRLSSPELDDLYAVAKREGALGGKITGAGGGGYMLLYCDFERKHALAEKMRSMGCEIHDFALEPLGLQSWRVNGNFGH